MEDEDTIKRKYNDLVDTMNSYHSMEDKFDGGLDMQSLYDALRIIDPDLAHTKIDSTSSIVSSSDGDSKTIVTKTPVGISSIKKRLIERSNIEEWIQKLNDRGVGLDDVCLDILENQNLRIVLFEGDVGKITPSVLPNLSVISLLSKLLDKMNGATEFEPKSYEFHLNLRLITNLISFYEKYDYKLRKDAMIYFNKLWKRYK